MQLSPVQVAVLDEFGADLPTLQERKSGDDDPKADERQRMNALVGFGIIVAGFALLESREISAELVKYRNLYR